MNQAQKNKVKQLTYLEIRKESQQDKEERVLLYEVENNLSNLLEDIRATSRALTEAQHNRINLIQTSDVDWSKLAEHDNNIDSLKRGLDKLKQYRNIYFPDWKTIVTEE